MTRGAGGIAVLGAEGVLEDALQHLGGLLVCEERQTVRVPETERTQVVHAEHVIGVAVSVEHSVQVAQIQPGSLRVEVGAGIDQDLVGLLGGRVLAVGQQDRRTGTAIGRPRQAGIGADGALTTEGRHAHRGAGAEKGEGCLHEVALRVGSGLRFAFALRMLGLRWCWEPDWLPNGLAK